MSPKKCCICGKKFIGYGNNPDPIKKKGKCCNECNETKVIPARITQMCLKEKSEE